MTGRRAVLIAGPTASGKSALALRLAAEQDAIIVNADAMQVYDTLEIVTARPNAADLALAEHRLYGNVPAATRFSTGQWLTAARATLDSATPDRPVIFVGGTGLYFDALINGFADIPQVPESIAQDIAAEIAGLDAAGRMSLLHREDSATADRLGVVDPQRLIRALAVKRATGRTLSSFQDDQQDGSLADFEVERMVLDPDRAVLRERIARRFEAMFSGGAVDEVKALLAQQLDPRLPVMKAIGAREISCWLDGTLQREEAIALATIATQQYAKRQRTWFRNRFADWPRRDPSGF